MDKLYRPSKDDIFTQFWNREAGFSPPRNFSRRVSASEVCFSFISVCYWVYRAIDSSFAFGKVGILMNWVGSIVAVLLSWELVRVFARFY